MSTAHIQPATTEQLRQEEEGVRVIGEATELEYQDYIKSERGRLADILGVDISEITNPALNHLIGDEDEHSVRATWAAKPWHHPASPDPKNPAPAPGL